METWLVKMVCTKRTQNALESPANSLIIKDRYVVLVDGQKLVVLDALINTVIGESSFLLAATQNITMDFVETAQEWKFFLMLDGRAHFFSLKKNFDFPLLQV